MLAILLLFSLLLPGCACREENTGRDTVSIWYLQEQTLQGLEELAEEYNREKGKDSLPVSLRAFADEKAMAEALDLTRPDLLLCDYRKAEEWEEKGHLRKLNGQLPGGPDYSGSLGARLPFAGASYFPVGSAVQLLCSGKQDPDALSDPEKLCEEVLRYRKKEGSAGFTADDFAAFFYHALLSADTQFHADMKQDKREDRFKYVYNLLAETAVEGGLLSTAYRAADAVESGALPFALADSRTLPGFSGLVGPSPVFQRSLQYPGRTLGFAVTAGESRDASHIAAFLAFLYGEERSCSLALANGLVPALPAEQEEAGELEQCLLELAFYYELHLPDKDSDYEKNRLTFEAAFRNTLERLY